MRRLLPLCAVLLFAGLAQSQSLQHQRLRLAESLDGYIYIHAYHTTLDGMEYIQGFPPSHFANFKQIEGVYAGLYDELPSTVEKFEIFIRQSDTTGLKPDMVSPPLYRIAGTTKVGGPTAAWASQEVIFPKSVVMPKGIIWVGVWTAKKTSATDFLRMGGQNKHGVGTTVFGVEPKQGVTNTLAYYSNYSGGKPGPLTQTDYGWVWNIGMLTKKALLTVYSVCHIDRGSGTYMAPKDTKDYSYGGMWPDLLNSHAYPTPGRLDDFGFKIEQKNVGTGNVTHAFIFMSDKLLPMALPHAMGDWALVFGGAFWTISPLFSPLTQGKWETPEMKIPAIVRPYLLNTNLYGQAILAEFDSQMQLVGLEMSNMAGMEF